MAERGLANLQTLDNKIKEYEVERHALFFTDADSKRIYKESVKYTLLRRNSVNGRTYKDDPTIFSWGLLNEPRCETWKARRCTPDKLYLQHIYVLFTSSQLSEESEATGPEKLLCR